MHRFTLSNLARLIQQLLVGTLLCMSVAACAGGNPTVAMTQGATPSFVRSTMQTGNAAIADEHNGCSSYNGERLYTDNPSGQAQQAIVFAFKANAHGSTLPLCTISYGGLSRPGGMVDDASGKLWVMDSEDISLMVFPHTANGSSPPAQAISGSNTLLVGFEAAGYQGIAVDQAGNVWVPCWYDYNNPYGYLVAFANNANGNVAPVATIGFGDKGVGEHIASPLAEPSITKVTSTSPNSTRSSLCSHRRLRTHQGRSQPGTSLIRIQRSTSPSIPTTTSTSGDRAASTSSREASSLKVSCGGTFQHPAQTDSTTSKSITRIT